MTLVYINIKKRCKKMCFCCENVDFLYLGGSVRGCRGGHAWLSGGRACVVAWGVVRGCQEGGVHGCWGACVVVRGGECGCQGGVCGCPGACMVARGACMVARGGLRGCQGVCGHVTRTPPPPCGQTDTCKNITFANFVCGR